VPGQVEYEQSRKLILRNVDGIVFVVDSSAERRTANQEALIGMITNLKELGVSLDKIPWVLQYNKQDLADAMTSEQINRDLNGAKVPFFEAIATTGKGVFATLKGMTKLVCRLDTLQDD
jgi:signal recognition particle receptor subunit beta